MALLYGPAPMRYLAVLAALSASLSSSPAARAQSGEVLKPYIVLIMDVSGSMVLNSTGAGAPSCGGTDTRFDHAKCALQKIVDSYGDMVFALARFRQTSSDTSCGDGCVISGVDCEDCFDELVAGGTTPSCTSA